MQVKKEEEALASIIGKKPTETISPRVRGCNKVLPGGGPLFLLITSPV